MIRRPPRSTLSSSSAASDVYKRQGIVTQHLFKINTIFLVGLLIIGSIMAYIYFHKKNKINLLFAFIMITVAITGALWLTVADLKPSIISSFNNQQITGEGTVKSL